VLNRVGRAKPAEVARLAGLDRTTTYRLLATLVRLGLVSRNQSSDEYLLLPAVSELSDGISHRTILSQIVSEELGQRFGDLLWPTDFAIFQNGMMVTTESTHRLSPYSIELGIVGTNRSLFASAQGHAYLARCDAPQRAIAINMAVEAEGAESKTIPADIAVFVKRISDSFDRYGCGIALTGPKYRSSIALPVMGGRFVAGAMSLVFFRSAIAIDEAIERYLPVMRTCVGAIERRLAATARPGTSA
jgi:IclR family mhp operon transcriptional activator